MSPKTLESAHRLWLLQEARRIREAAQRGEMDDTERLTRLRALKRPRGMIARLFGL